MKPEEFWQTLAPDLRAYLEAAHRRQRLEVLRLAWLAAKIINHSGFASRGVSVDELLSEWGYRQEDA